jgi:hypothetical protein
VIISKSIYSKLISTKFSVTNTTFRTDMCSINNRCENPQKISISSDGVWWISLQASKSWSIYTEHLYFAGSIPKSKHAHSIASTLLPFPTYLLFQYCMAANRSIAGTIGKRFVNQILSPARPVPVTASRYRVCLLFFFHFWCIYVAPVAMVFALISLICVREF